MGQIPVGLLLRLGWALALAALAGCADPPAVVERPRAGNTDVTFFAAADLHLGTEGIGPIPPEELLMPRKLPPRQPVVSTETIARSQVEAMNALPGIPLPEELGGVVQAPRGVIIAGDMTDHGRDDAGSPQWQAFVKLYGLTGKDGLLKYPVYECTGNHDRWTPLSYLFRRPVIEAVRRRHGGLLYSWDFGDVHLVSLDLYPDLGARLWLRRDLAAVGRQRPVVIFFHYPLAGLYSKWWSRLDQSAFRDTLAGFNVVGIFHGHYHHPEHYTWNGYDVYNTGSCRHWPHAFAVVRITDDRMTVAARNWDAGRWLWWHDKRINPETSAAANQSAKPPLRQ